MAHAPPAGLERSPQLADRPGLARWNLPVGDAELLQHGEFGYRLLDPQVLGRLDHDAAARSIAERVAEPRPSRGRAVVLDGGPAPRTGRVMHSLSTALTERKRPGGGSVVALAHRFALRLRPGTRAAPR